MMILHPPTLRTDRLVLRPFAFSDAKRVQELAGAREIANGTLFVPHPYEDGVAEKWIASHAVDFYSGSGIVLAVVLRESDELIGAIELSTKSTHKRGEIGYWIGVPYWNNGYCTEALREMIRYGFSVVGHHKITAYHSESNPASGRVMEKAGMKTEGVLIDNQLVDGRFHSTRAYGIINPEDKQ